MTNPIVIINTSSLPYGWGRQYDCGQNIWWPFVKQYNIACIRTWCVCPCNRSFRELEIQSLVFCSNGLRSWLRSVYYGTRFLKCLNVLVWTAFERANDWRILPWTFEPCKIASFKRHSIEVANKLFWPSLWTKCMTSFEDRLQPQT